MPLEREPFINIAYADIANQIRGKGFPAGELEKRRAHGVGWTPTNIMINCFGRIPATPWGAVGDLELVPDPQGDVVLELGNGVREHFILGDVRNLDGTPWACCPRSFLRHALEALKQETGLSLTAAFEHEFHYTGAKERVSDAYSIGSFRGSEAFFETLLAAIRANGLEPDTLLPEFGPRQFEITIDPAEGLVAADRAVKLKEITRAVAEHFGGRASFSPVVTPGIVGNGVHIHFSFRDADGKPATYDASGPHGMSAVTAAFAAGILKYSPELVAITAPAVISYERLKPNSWSAYWTNLGVRDREATLRVCPVPEHGEVDVAKRYNLEFRAADAAGNPYLQLGILVYAGLAGIRQKLGAPQVTAGSPADLSQAEREAKGFRELPRSLPLALDAMEGCGDMREWMGADLFAAYIMHKRGEAAMLEGLDLATLCQRYAEVY
ncbi:glutamine synthetase [Aureimonas fodinaquatilis]|uniref:Glutamine synthetase n=1 Tax=Aureimonas fodinaquatilis TaxID=2565783 RepID=A0A5B0DUZ1_9HYPH|nr:glutamine synthetase family protein [Aureimonas fodinaquatilis]KAA0969611.1 glutamine synthetase [Aureimonas fodinaquatilis]